MSQLVRLPAALRAAVGALLILPALTGPSASADPATNNLASEQALGRRLELMLRTLRIARDWHVNRPGKAELIDGAIDGMLKRVDVEAEYYSAAELRRFLRNRPAADVGVEVRREPAPRRGSSPGYRIISTADGTAAAIAGLKAGDLVTHVDGQPAGDMLHLLIEHAELAGGADKPVLLTVERLGRTAPEEVVLLRRRRKSGPAELREPETGVLVVRIGWIEKPVAAQLEREIGAASATMGGKLRGLVIDLRATAGGDVAAVAEIADVFMDRGIVLSLERRKAEADGPVRATPGDAAGGRPIAVLVDEGTAGPAEALAAALRDNGRAKVIGSRSAGRGAIRTLSLLGRSGAKGAIRMTVARLRTPAGLAIEGNGLLPDVTIAQAPLDSTCRSMDRRDAREGAPCRLRTLEEDAQLRAAIVALSDTLVSGGALPTGSLAPTGASTR